MAHVPEVERWSNFNGTRKIKIIKNYAIYKLCLKIIIFLFLSLKNVISFGHVKIF